ncbi:hypothetical protein DSO57_1016922 [Entomophthora muscae]|uniref:Uncharacterized protein n=1 Tax=Entomophthora muscae TaxID=34485 RepID=A0ACC2SU44_9FUNG|nr:hypothetical protein DSO57_1016922 [Entomophthora muscae]
MEWVQDALKTGLCYYRDVVTWKAECAYFLPSCFVPTTIHALLDPSPVLQERKVSIPCFICIPGSNQVIAVEVEGKTGHTMHHCHHRKSVYYWDIVFEPEEGITWFKNKTFLCPNPVAWIPPSFTHLHELIVTWAMLAQRHRAAQEANAGEVTEWKKDEEAKWQQKPAKAKAQPKTTAKSAPKPANANKTPKTKTTPRKTQAQESTDMEEDFSAEDMANAHSASHMSPGPFLSKSKWNPKSSQAPQPNQQPTSDNNEPHTHGLGDQL